MRGSRDAFGADIVGGPQMPVFPDNSDQRLAAHPVFAPPYRQSGPVDALYSSGNLLIGRHVLTAMGAPFLDLRFNFMGGGDSDFLSRAAAEGFPARLVRRGAGPRNGAGAPARGRLDPLAQPAQRRHLDAGREEEARGLAASAICASSPRAWRCSPPRRSAASCGWPQPARRRPPSIPSMSRSAACLRNSAMRMSSTGSLRRTERGSLAEAFPAARVATIIAAILLTTVIVSFRPFQPGGAEPSPEGGGDIVNQLGFSMLGGLALFAIMAFAKPRVISVFFSPCWLLLLAFFALSVAQRGRPFRCRARGLLHGHRHRHHRRRAGAAARRGFVFGGARLRRHHRRRRQLYRRRAACPTWRSTRPNSAEPEHAGLWRGLFAHKNLAGPVMACFSFAGLYLLRRGWRYRGAVPARRRHDLHGQYRLQDHGRPGAAHHHDRRAARPDRHAAGDRRAVCAGHGRHRRSRRSASSSSSR